MDSVGQNHSIRRGSLVLGIRRQTYYRRKQGHRPEEVDRAIADLLKGVAKKFVAWGFWMIFHYLTSAILILTKRG